MIRFHKRCVITVVLMAHHAVLQLNMAHVVIIDRTVVS